jgi:hypothetical protein
LTVYVDDFGIEATVHDPGSGRHYTSRWSHLFCDGDLAELHAFAALIGLRRAWFQGPPEHRRPHYDVTARRRERAIRAGAVAVTWRQAAAILRAARAAATGQATTAAAPDRIPALTLHRPWPACFTDLPAEWAKRHENRGWATGHRGDVLLHAGKQWDPAALVLAARIGAAHTRRTGVGPGPAGTPLSADPADHPTGFVAIAELVGICAAAATDGVCGCGDWTFLGQRHWTFVRVRKLRQVVPWSGARGLWWPPAPVVVDCYAQLGMATTP